jgi:alkylation response protein AidB-like acyl-CoA dehydrogenase
MSSDTTALRAEVAAWLAEHWDPDLSLREWRERLVDARWAVPTWPVDRFGRGLSVSESHVVAEELARVGAVGVPSGGGMGLAAPTLLEHGSVELQQRLLRPILTGEHFWCQLFSEPGSGSDLAGLTTRADRDGDQFVINGQKVWNTSAHHADYGLLVARTDWDVPKHAGITYFAIDMRQPGIEVRQLRQMNGHASFNEVFFTDARVPVADVIGEVGNGWRVALTTLAHERRLGRASDHLRDDQGEGRVLREARAETEEHSRPYVWYPQRMGRPDLVIDLARRAGRLDDPVLRQSIARLETLVRTARWTARRAEAARAAGRQPGAEGSLGKLHTSHIARAAASVHTAIAGMDGLVVGPNRVAALDGSLEGVVAEILVSVPGQSIAGGTDEIQRNIVAEQVLGLPREPSVDRTLPFRDVPRNADRATTRR